MAQKNRFVRVRLFQSFLLFMFLFSVSISVYAENTIHFSIEPHFSYNYGMLTEALYDSGKNGRIRSELEWDKNIFFYGIKTEVSFWRTHFNFNFDMGIPEKSGEMRDSDWMNESNTAMKTTYSVGTNNAVQNYAAHAFFAFDFFPFNDSDSRVFIVSPLVGIQYSYDSFDRSDAQGWYGQSVYSSDRKYHWWYEDEAKKIPYTCWSEEKNRFVTKKLAGVSYERKSFFAWTGAKCDFKINNRFRLNFSALVSPYSYFYSLDTHHGSESEYKGIQRGFFSYFKFGIDSQFKLNSRFAVHLGSSALVGKTLRGPVFENNVRDTLSRSGSNTFAFCTEFGVTVRVK